ncbi:hypothetical protein CBER1_07421 [Cercospora berteroae]|uniref:Heterokaryon incompatibility domain-containing protein n=1 Tax=Cercospora berteroae TaxID=357750 RepID=A0A2S6CMW8_9PEZI|nr:hypothetical protein CBER1_07421 [Cercospora berteroae]
MPSKELEYRVNGLKICKKCSEFELECVAHIYVLRESSEESLTLRPTVTTLHNTFAEMQASAKLGCNSCLVWHKAILNECHSSKDEDLLYQSHTPVILVPPTTATSTGFWIAISSPMETKVRLAPTRSAAWATFDAGINRDPFGQEIWREVKRQLSNCRNTHESYRAHPGSGKLPRRLIHLQNDDTARICETADLPQKPNYLALSYLWGGNQRVKFTAQHERRLKEGVPRTEFPMTIQDTFKVCRLLSISYVWIDALCIRQDDDGKDFREESERMDLIYGSATITLIAVKAQGVQEGFLMPSPMEQYTVDPWKTDYADQIMLMIPRKGLTEVRAMSPLAKRGWCFRQTIVHDWPRNFLVVLREQVCRAW